MLIGKNTKKKKNPPNPKISISYLWVSNKPTTEMSYVTLITNKSFTNFYKWTLFIIRKFSNNVYKKFSKYQ